MRGGFNFLERVNKIQPVFASEGDTEEDIGKEKCRVAIEERKVWGKLNSQNSKI